MTLLYQLQKRATSYDKGHLAFMGRWWLVKPRWWFPLKVTLHCTWASDPTPNLHDHPWDWCSIVIKGECYEVVKGGKHLYKKGSIRFHRAETPHRMQIMKGAPPCWTLFITGPSRRDWGFYKRGKWIHWLEFINNTEGRK